jgi:hypothetical protein
MFIGFRRTAKTEKKGHQLMHPVTHALTHLVLVSLGKLALVLLDRFFLWLPGTFYQPMALQEKKRTAVTEGKVKNLLTEPRRRP